MTIKHEYQKQYKTYNTEDLKDIDILKKRCISLYRHAKNYREMYNKIYENTIADAEFKKLPELHQAYFKRFSKIALRRLKSRFNNAVMPTQKGAKE